MGDHQALAVDKSQYATAALVRHLGGSMAIRAANQLQWDIGGDLTGGYGSRVQGTGQISGSPYGTSMYGGGDERSVRVHHLTARVYPPAPDYCSSAQSTPYGRLPCGCTDTPTYSASTNSTPRGRDMLPVATPGCDDAATMYYILDSSLKRRKRRQSTGRIVDATSDTATLTAATLPLASRSTSTATSQQPETRDQTGSGLSPSKHSRQGDDDATVSTVSSSSPGSQQQQQLDPTSSCTVPELLYDCNLQQTGVGFNGCVADRDRDDPPSMYGTQNI